MKIDILREAMDGRRQQMNRTIAVLLLVLLVGCGVSISQATEGQSAPDPVSEIVRCTEIRFSLTVEQQNAARFAEMLDEDARFISNGVLRGSGEVAQAWSAFFEQDAPRLVWRPFIVEVAASGDLAFSRGPYRLRSSDAAGNPVESWGMYNSVWRKSPDGEWRILFDAGNAGEDQVNAEMKALLDQPVGDCASGDPG